MAMNYRSGPAMLCEFKILNARQIGGLQSRLIVTLSPHGRFETICGRHVSRPGAARVILEALGDRCPPDQVI